MKKLLPLIAAIATLAAAFAPQPAQARVIKIYTYNGPSRKPVAVTGVALSVANTTLSVGETLTLKENVLPANATNKAVRWASSDTAVATVENGLVAALDTGVTTITVTTDDGGKTATCNILVCHFADDGICWADVNVDEYQTFAVRPDMYTKFYQWNRSKAWAAEGSVIGWNPTPETDTVWTINPCPIGWRLPKRKELQWLLTDGGVWANAMERGNIVGGRFYGTNAATCSLPNNMGGCVFLPASGYRDEYGDLRIGSTRFTVFWCSSDGYEGGFSINGGNMVTNRPNSSGYNLRCVR